MPTKSVMDIEKSAKILKVLGDKTRLTMLKLMEDQTCCVCEFVEIFQMSQPSISQHLRKLRDMDLIKEERKGQWVFYSLNHESDWNSFILSIIDSLPSQQDKIAELEKNGTRITCC